MSTQPVKRVVKQVKPLLSTNHDEARKRVFNLYRAWYRQIPQMIVEYHLPLTNKEAKTKLKEEFIKHKNIKDLRVIDMLVIKGQMELMEVVKRWKQSCHIMFKFEDNRYPKSKSFLSNFLSGGD